MLDIAADGELVSMIKAASGKILIASSAGHGLVTDIENAIAQTRTGKQVLNVGGGARAVRCIAVDGDSVAVVGQNRKLPSSRWTRYLNWQKAKG